MGVIVAYIGYGTVTRNIRLYRYMRQTHLFIYSFPLFASKPAADVGIDQRTLAVGG